MNGFPQYTKYNNSNNNRFRRSRAAMFPESSSYLTNGVVLPRAVLSLAALSLSCFLLYYCSASFLLFSSSSPPAHFFFSSPTLIDDLASDEHKLEKVLKDAAMGDKTVILTTLNEAWAAPNSVFDLFLESFRMGERTLGLLDHLVIVTLDKKAYKRCLQLHTHCFALPTEGLDFRQEAYFMTPVYLKMMWRRIDFLRSVLELGYNFVFSDADIMWFRNPFPRFHVEADFQIACDHYLGSSVDLRNIPNGGFNFVRSNNRSIEFYKFWYSSRERFPGYHDQDVLNFIKSDPFIEVLGLKMRFLDTAYFGGLCEPSRDLNFVCTMHANCCYGLDSKLHDLRVMIQDWKNFLSLPPTLKRSSVMSWRVPQNCSLNSLRRHGSSEKKSITQGLQE